MTTDPVVPADYGHIHTGIVELLESARRAAARSVNALMTASYWEIGRRIVEFEQGGAERIDISTRYREVGARSFGKGLFVKPDFDGALATWQKPVWIEEGDLVLSNIKAWEGAIAVARNEYSGCIASHRYITCVPSLNVVTAGFLAYFLLSPEGLEKIGSASPGTADRNRTLSLTSLGKIKVPNPPIEIQRAFDALHAKIAELKAKHAAIREANQALLPATLERVFATTG